MVSFVGAGPGAVDLITLRGARLLEQADVVIYAGSLVNPALLSHCKTDAALHDSAHLTLEQVLALAREAEQNGLRTVRLHTGDPCLYGAIREQMDALDAAGISYEYVPGVSSFCGAAAALGAEYTLPGVSQSVIITRMAGRTPVPEAEDIARLASHGATMVIFLSTGMLEQLSQKLMEGGYAPDSPAALVYRASWPDEIVVRGTVAALPEMARAHNIERMALVCVGGFLEGPYDRSLLYHPAFTHGYRQGQADAP